MSCHRNTVDSPTPSVEETWGNLSADYIKKTGLPMLRPSLTDIVKAVTSLKINKLQALTRYQLRWLGSVANI